jgi:hypothetical protein
MPRFCRRPSAGASRDSFPRSHAATTTTSEIRHLRPCDTAPMMQSRTVVWAPLLLFACGHAPAGSGQQASSPSGTAGAPPLSEAKPQEVEAAQPAEGRMAWGKRVDAGTRRAVVEALNKMWAGALSYYESDHPAPQGKLLPKHFPGDAQTHFTPDCCKSPAACAEQPWATEQPWLSLNFSPPERSRRLRFDFRSIGTEGAAQFLGVVAVDPACNGHPFYVWRKGHINDGGDLVGEYLPSVTEYPPELEAETGAK